MKGYPMQPEKKQYSRVTPKNYSPTNVFYISSSRSHASFLLEIFYVYDKNVNLFVDIHRLVVAEKPCCHYLCPVELLHHGHTR